VLELIFVLRLVHVVAGVGWAGEVLTVNFVLLPALFKARADERVTLLQTVFPYAFRLATLLAGIAIARAAMHGDVDLISRILILS
jgi:uncharacterized membrane protein